ncbi:immunoglobulin superfamily member 6 [Anomaloglossus baeobatrachus]|uniref:immunoglobulin superfamily member 6 n=1 Tax=Anomaloglossus baeobatrachus TaxID=238106 RepID=UPI003F4FBD72
MFSSPFRRNILRQEMDRSNLAGCVFLQFILTYCHCGVRSCTVKVDQKEFSEVLLEQKTVNVSCEYKASNCPGKEKIFWFRYLESKHEQLNPDDGKQFKVKNTNGKSVLTIEDIATKDSGIYICGLVFPDSSDPNSKVAGRGTTLIIREKPDTAITPTNTALIVLCTLTAMYCIAVFSYYSFKSKWRICKLIRSKRVFTTKSNRTYKTRSVFQAIAAEYQKRYHRKSSKQNQVIEDDRIYQNTQDLH